MIILMKAIDQYFNEVLFIMMQKAVLSFKFLDEILVSPVFTIIIQLHFSEYK